MAIIYIGKHLKMYNVENHKHDYNEIVYCTGGNGEFIDTSKNKHMQYTEGDCVIIPKNIVHRNTSSAGFSNIYLAVSDLDIRINDITKVSDSENKDLFSSLNQAYYYFNCEQPNKFNIMVNLCDLIMNYIISFIGVNRCSTYTEQIVADIINNFSNIEYTVHNVIEKVPLNNEYIRKLFVKEKGITPLKFLTKVRIEHAQQLLAAKEEYGLSIQEISYACGFENPLYFSRVFKKYTTLCPKEFSDKYMTILE